MLNTGSFDDKLQCFYDAINRIIDNTVQMKPHKHSKHRKWFDKEAITLKNQNWKNYYNAAILRIWEHMEIVFCLPHFQKGKKHSIENYRGVAIQCTIPKLLESMVTKHTNSYCNTLIPQHKHGFVSGRSKVTYLTDFISKAMNCLENSKQVDAIYLDTQKAFDSVDINENRIYKWPTEYHGKEI